MPDEFPTLEVVAAIATLAALVRVVEVARALGELRRLSGKVARALRAGDREKARRVCAESEGAAFSSVATALLEALEEFPGDQGVLARTVEQAAARVAKRSRRASTSGGLIGLLLVGLLFYAIVSRVSRTSQAGPSTLFDVLVILGVVVLTVGIVLNQRLASETRNAARRMLEATKSSKSEPAR
jgi:hypothetical protein